MNRYSRYILYMLICIFVAILYVNDFGPMHNLQRSFNDLLCSLTSEEGARPGVVLVRVDAKAQNEFGEWPWDYDLIADLTAAVASAEPKAIVLNFDLSEDAAQNSTGHTDILVEQLQWIDQAVLTYDIALANFRSDRTRNPDNLFKNSVTVDNRLGLMGEQSSLLARKVFLPSEKLLVHKPYLGFNYIQPDDDRVLRYQPMLTHFEGYYYPSLPLVSSAAYLGMSPEQIMVVEGKEIRIGSQLTIPVNKQGDMFIRFSEGIPFVQYSAADILAEGFNLGVLKDKAVLIGLSEADAEELYTTPTDDRVSPLVVNATVLENIINQNVLAVRDDMSGINLLVLFLLGGICAFVLPRVNLIYRMVILGGSLVLLINAVYVVFASYSIIIESVYVGLELLLFMAASPMLESQLLAGAADQKGSTRTEKQPKPSKAKTTHETIQVPVREIKAKNSDQENVETRMIGKESADASEISAIDHQTLNTELDDGLETMATPSDKVTTSTQDETLSDDAQPAKPTELRPEEISLDESPVGEQIGDAAPVKETPVVASSQQIQTLNPNDIKNLGRYQVTGILGKGAMGTVYKGVDPAINRPVALKTIRLDFVSDPEELAELKERLHREAQAAGKLSHPNIVTIYDVGNEGSLQYIAMEYLEGRPLEDLIKKKVRFNYRIIAQIITQICSALEYAHDKGIVHRDIKPANIMVQSDYRVKVMDYGIARVDSNSMTKTGIAMGTPNYISPEQLKGQKIDRRADLFSLGVVMYEMLLGRRPFKGENITALIYAIMNNEPEKPSNVRPQVPLLFDHIIGKALKKDPAERYQKASEITTDLSDFVESFATR